MTDFSQRFIFADTDIRGEIVSLEQSLQEILGNHNYPAVVESLLGEFAAAAILLGSTIKFEGSLTLQARSDGEVPVIMAEVTHDKTVRAIARDCQDASSDDFRVLLAKGTLAITIDPKHGQRYQGIVPLEGANLGECLGHYFEQSEQLKTHVKLSADNQRSCGILLQQLPVGKVGDAELREQQWEHISQLVGTTRPDEMLAVSSHQMLYRLFHEDKVEMFAAHDVSFACSCSRERVLNAVATLGEEEARKALAQTGAISMNCDFCNSQYRVEEIDLSSIFNSDNSQTVH
ncbi:molecular chaperone Hsp33 [Sinobacterium caligoides]|uniref:Molecular chaperone Hsp33 n=1 Tax=Sinobacterium caligoides TaxID=933926 RepID=A0A3N2DGH9_9GAMM|nr:Hsp33 family molecular chaperone HslO [Sinobacterium caligoides]ROR98892.1 molecular chaperone Hsp33 [Sinobacterium caligoides]